VTRFVFAPDEKRTIQQPANPVANAKSVSFQYSPNSDRAVTVATIRNLRFSRHPMLAWKPFTFFLSLAAARTHLWLPSPSLFEFPATITSGVFHRDQRAMRPRSNCPPSPMFIDPGTCAAPKSAAGRTSRIISPRVRARLDFLRRHRLQVRQVTSAGQPLRD
jgi:hypothetical protein